MSLQQIQSQILERPMTYFQWRVVAIGVLVNMLDGFDLLAASIIAPIITKEWGLQPEALGMLLSASLLGTSIGAFLLSPVADTLGRRNAIMINLGLMALGMLLSAKATSVMELTLLRILTGMGVGAMASAVGTLVFEYSASSARELGLGLVTIGYNVGVIVGTFFAAWFLGIYSWPAIFVLGGLLTLGMIPVVYFFLPESIDFMVTRPKKDTLTNLNSVLAKMAMPGVSQLPSLNNDKESTGQIKDSLWDLIRSPLLSRTLLMGLSYMLYMLSSYFFLNWGNQLTVDAGYSLEQGIYVARITNYGGLVGGVVIGIFCYKMAFRAVSTAILLAMGALIIVFGYVYDEISIINITSFLIGFGIFGAAVVLYSTAAKTFPSRVRATGVGVSMGAGRFGAFLGPLLAGYLLGGGILRPETCLLMALPVLLSAFTLRKVPLTKVPD
jgi:benzoate transport